MKYNCFVVLQLIQTVLKQIFIGIIALRKLYTDLSITKKYVKSSKLSQAVINS